MGSLKKVWAWLKKFGVWIALGLLTVFGFGWLWQRRGKIIGALKDRVAVEQAVSRTKALQAQREILKEQDAEHVEEIERIDTELARQRQQIRDAFENGDKATEEEIDAELARLGL
jgi:hypothetical protein